MSCRMSMGGAECVEGADPRYVGHCYRCGDPLPPSTRRDRDFEARCLRELTAGLNVDVEPLIRLSDHRANVGAKHYGREFPDLERDLELDGLEEGCDWANYLRWRLDAIQRGLVEGQEWKIEYLQTALRYVALAFEQTRAARG